MDDNMLKWFHNPQIKLTQNKQTKKPNKTKKSCHWTLKLVFVISISNFSIQYNTIHSTIHYPEQRTGSPNDSVPRVCVLILKTTFQSQLAAL